MKRLLKVIVVLPMCLGVSVVHAAEWKSVFTVPVGLGYTDNAELKPDAQKESDFFWRISPGFSTVVEAPRWNAAVNYSYLWEQHSKDDKHSDNHKLNARLASELVDNLFFVDANAAISQVRQNLLDPVGFETQNLDDVFTWRVQPALKRRFANTSQGGVGVSAYGVDASGSSSLSSGVGRVVNANYSTGEMLDIARFDLLAKDDRFQYDQPPSGNAVRDDTLNQSASIRATLLKSRKFTPYASYGYENIEDTTLRRQPSQTYWNAGGIWQPSARTQLDANFGKRFFGDTWNVAFVHRTRQSNWSLNYVQDLRTGQEDVLIPDSVNTFNQLNSQLRTAIPDPAARASFVRAFMDSQGLPPTSLLVTRNYVDKKLSANVSYLTVRSSSLLNLYARDSDASEVSLPLPPTAGGQALGDHIQQKGINLTWNYRLSPLLRCTAVTGYVAESYPDVSIDDENVFFRLGLNYQLGRHFATSSEIRRIQRSSNSAVREYTENSVLLTLISTF